MPGIAGYLTTSANGSNPAPVLEAMVRPLVYAPAQEAECFHHQWFAAAAVDYGESFSFLKKSSAYRDRVLCLMQGEVFCDSAESSREFATQAPCIQRAEYCLNLYLQHGLDFVKQLNGSFAIVVFDGRERRAHLFTDRFGSLPVYYWCDGEKLVFATRVASVLAYDRNHIGRKYNKDAVAELILSEKVRGEKTLFEDIHRLLPGSRLTWDGKCLEHKKYWTISYPSEVPKHTSWKEAAAELLTLVKQSVQKRTADDARTMVLVSGGLDSRLILACCPPEILAGTFTDRGRPNARETRLAIKVAQTLGHEHRCLERNEDYYASIPALATEVNEGLCNVICCHSLGIQDQMAQSGVKVVLSGLLFDTFFKGMFSECHESSGTYPNEPALLRSRRIARSMADSVVFHRIHHQDLMMLTLSGEMRDRAAIAKERFIGGAASLDLGEISAQEWSEQMMFRNLENYSDWGFVRGLATSFVSRVPSLDNELFAFACRTPAEWKKDGRLVRWALRIANPKVAQLPDANTGLPAAWCPPWNRILGGLRDSPRRFAKKLLPYSAWLKDLREERRAGCQVFTGTSWHDIDALLLRCPSYRALVESTVKELNPEYFHRENILALLKDDLQASKPRFKKLFQLLLTFALFDARWGPSANRNPDRVPLPKMHMTQLNAGGERRLC